MDREAAIAQRTGQIRARGECFTRQSDGAEFSALRRYLEPEELPIDVAPTEIPSEEWKAVAGDFTSVPTIGESFTDATGAKYRLVARKTRAADGTYLLSVKGR